MNTKNEILAYVRDTEPVPPIDIINHVSYKYPNMVNSFLTNMINREILFVNNNNCITTSRDKKIEKDTINFIIKHDRASKYFLLHNSSNSQNKIIKKFIHNNYLINVSTNNWSINPEKCKEIFHDIYGFDIEKSKILGKRLSEYKKIFKYDTFIFSD